VIKIPPQAIACGGILCKDIKLIDVPIHSALQQALINHYKVVLKSSRSKIQELFSYTSLPER
jgi:hypothetical protein